MQVIVTDSQIVWAIICSVSSGAFGIICGQRFINIIFVSSLLFILCIAYAINDGLPLAN